MNEPITCHAVEALGFEEFDKRAFTSAKRAESFIEEFCSKCPVLIECGQAVLDIEPADRFGTWGGEFYA